MTIKLPKNIKHEFEFYINKKDRGLSGYKEVSPRNLINFIENSGGVFGYGSCLHKYLFDSKGFQQNQLNFLNAFYGKDYLFEEERFEYLTDDGKNVIYIPSKKIFITGESIIEITKFYGISQTVFTRDEILDSPFDINKLKEVPLNETNSNDSND